MGFAKTGTHDNDILELVLLTFKKKLYEKSMIYSTIFLSLHIKKNVCRVLRIGFWRKHDFCVKPFN